MGNPPRVALPLRIAALGPYVRFRGEQRKCRFPAVEAGAPPGESPERKGLSAIRAKGEWWYANHEVHQVTITGPWPHGDRFILGFKIDVTPKATGKRFQMEEMALYTIDNGKIVREEFFYYMGG